MCIGDSLHVYLSVYNRLLKRHIVAMGREAGSESVVPYETFQEKCMTMLF